MSSGRQQSRAEEEKKAALGELERFSGVLSVPDAVRDEAGRLCARGLTRGLGVGRPLPRVVVASLYAACRERGFPCSIDDLVEASGLGRKEIATCYRMLVRELDVKIPVAEPAEYVAMVASRAKASTTVQADALDILSRARKAGAVAGRNPIGMAASALYVASAQEGERLTQHDAAEAAGVTEATLRGEYKHLKKVL